MPNHNFLSCAEAEIVLNSLYCGKLRQSHNLTLTLIRQRSFNSSELSSCTTTCSSVSG